MIEIVCRENQLEEKEKPELNLPKNIRQMGSPKGRHKIYVEDYVYTYLHNQAQKNTRCAAVLLGKSQVSKDIRYTFIYGAVECGQAVFQWENIYLDESFWQYIYEEEQHYFPDTDIVGWFVGEQGKEAVLSANIESAHRKYFAGRDKLLMLLDGVEQEELFYVYEQGYLQKKEGYYLYYEKNLPMQEYMVSKKEEERRNPKPPEEEEPLWRSPESDQEEEGSEWEALHKEIEELDNIKEIEEIPKVSEIKEGKEIEEISPEEKIFVKSSLEEPRTEAEKALQSYRSMVLEKQGKRVEQHNKRFLYTAASFLMLVICVIGITTVNNYRKMKEVESVLYVMKNSVEKKKEPEAKAVSDVVVESIAAGVKPLDQQDKAEPEKKKGDEQKKEVKKREKAEGSASQQEVNQENIKQEEVPKEEAEKKETEKPKEGENQEAAAPPELPEPQYYTVQKGDTLESICQKVYQNKKMVPTLCQANGIENGDKILAGQKLLLP